MSSEGDSQAVTTRVVLKNRLGMHARAAALFAKTASRYRSDIWVIKDSDAVNGKSIMGILTLIAPRGSVLTIKARGDDAELALRELVHLVESKFGEE